jgi:hypothetical protein
MLALDIAWLKSSLAHSLLPHCEKSMGYPCIFSLRGSGKLIGVQLRLFPEPVISSGRHCDHRQDDKLQTSNINHT